MPRSHASSCCSRPRTPDAVDVREADDLSREPAVGVDAPRLVEHADAVETELLDLLCPLVRDPARHEGERRVGPRGASRASAGRLPARAASSCAVRSTSARADGFAYTDGASTESASSAPLRSKITPRSGARRSTRWVWAIPRALPRSSVRRVRGACGECEEGKEQQDAGHEDSPRTDAHTARSHGRGSADTSGVRELDHALGAFEVQTARQLGQTRGVAEAAHSRGEQAVFLQQLLLLPHGGGQGVALPDQVDSQGGQAEGGHQGADQRHGKQTAASGSPRGESAPGRGR